MVRFGRLLDDLLWGCHRRTGIESHVLRQAQANFGTVCPDALAVSGFTRQECLDFDDPKLVMTQFQEWLSANCHGRTMFVSDNNGFDWQFINWYFHHFIGKNPLASARPISARSTKECRKTLS